MYCAILQPSHMNYFCNGIPVVSLSKWREILPKPPNDKGDWIPLASPIWKTQDSSPSCHTFGLDMQVTLTWRAEISWKRHDHLKDSIKSWRQRTADNIHQWRHVRTQCRNRPHLTLNPWVKTAHSTERQELFIGFLLLQIFDHGINTRFYIPTTSAIL